MNPIAICVVFSFGLIVGGIVAFKLMLFGMRQMTAIGLECGRQTCGCGEAHPDLLFVHLQHGPTQFKLRFAMGPELQQAMRASDAPGDPA